MIPAIELTDVVKDYHGLRPLRVRHLTVSDGEVVALDGLDGVAAEVLTNLVTGATLPDQGVVRVFGEDTGAIADADAWLASLDRFGIVSDRVTLVDALTLRQNIAIALTLDLEPMAQEVVAAVDMLASEAGLTADLLDGPTAAAPPAARLRARVARAIAASPRILLTEHPTASLPRADVSAVRTDFFRLVRRRRLAVLIASVDRDFISDSDRHEALDPATGAFKPRGLRAWFSRRS